MQGVFAGGVVQVLQDLSLYGAFDYIYGFSSGVCAGAYLLACDTRMGTSVYWDNLSGKRFINPWLLTRSMNMKYFVDQVLRFDKKLDVEKIKASSTIIKLYVTDTKKARLEYFTNRDGVDLFEVIKASCSVPGFSGRPPKINGTGYTDGNAFNLIPLDEAVKDGCTDILVVPNVPKDFRMKKYSFVQFMSEVFSLPLGSRFRKSYRKQAENYNKELDIVFGSSQLKDVNIAVIAPDYFMESAETRAEVLKRFEEHGIEKARAAFDTTLYSK